MSQLTTNYFVKRSISVNLKYVAFPGVGNTRNSASGQTSDVSVHDIAGAEGVIFRRQRGRRFRRSGLGEYGVEVTAGQVYGNGVLLSLLAVVVVRVVGVDTVVLVTLGVVAAIQSVVVYGLAKPVGKRCVWLLCPYHVLIASSP